jgi:hypothetical protein
LGGGDDFTVHDKRRRRVMIEGGYPENCGQANPWSPGTLR